MALLWPAMLALVLAVVQVALLYLAGQLALTAAQDGLRAGRYHPAASTDRARQVGEDFLARAAGTTLQAPTVTAALSGDGAVLQVDVTGTVADRAPRDRVAGGQTGRRRGRTPRTMTAEPSRSSGLSALYGGRR